MEQEPGAAMRAAREAAAAALPAPAEELGDEADGGVRKRRKLAAAEEALRHQETAVPRGGSGGSDGGSGGGGGGCGSGTMAWLADSEDVQLPWARRKAAAEGAAAVTAAAVDAAAAITADCRGASAADDTAAALAPARAEDVRRALEQERQIEEDATLALALQAADAEELAEQSRPWRDAPDVGVEGDSKELRGLASMADQCDQDREERSFGGCADPRTFRLLRIEGLPEWANDGCVGITEVIQGDIQWAVLSNYMVDLKWLLPACPLLRRIRRVVMVHGEDKSLPRLQAEKPKNWVLYKPPLRIPWGTHHSKAMLLVYPQGVRVVVHTANLIEVDWSYKSQGLWMQDFPCKEHGCERQTSVFEDDLLDYLTALEWPGCLVPAADGDGCDVKVDMSFFRRFDYSGATVRLVGSVPGYHQGSNLAKWGHMKLRDILQQEKCFPSVFRGSPLVYQFSSLGSLDEKWMEEFLISVSSGSCSSGCPLGVARDVRCIWPTVEDIRWSLEGYAAGGCVPGPEKNVEKAFLTKYWSRWQADDSGRARAMPHIKTFVRYSGSRLAWVLLTSSNLSKAAWGALQKNNKQLMVRSYELGVLFLPSLLAKAGSRTATYAVNPEPVPGLSFPVKSSSAVQDVDNAASVDVELQTRDWKADRAGGGSHEIVIPLPYALPPATYSTSDTPWAWDRVYRAPDAHGRLWPRSLNLYK
eukprot:SM000005S17246  [mRNA]  locus=s5:995817:999986:+ [translate_table: standard]